MIPSVIYLACLLLLINGIPEKSYLPIATLPAVPALYLGWAALTAIFAYYRLFPAALRVGTLLVFSILLYLLPYPSYFPNELALSATTLLLYLIVESIYPFFSNSKRRRKKETYRHLSLVLPFTIPYLILITTLELFPFLLETEIAFWTSLFIFIALNSALLPYSIQKLWSSSTPLNPSLQSKLDALCTRLKFRHGGTKVWAILPHSYTAAIVGMFAPFRYVLFTPGLLKNLTDENIVAVLTHEIAHIKKFHMIQYVLILLGIALAMTLPMQYLNGYPVIVYDLAIFLLGWRFLFGYFSRQFEREADLYAIEANVPPDHLIDALYHIGNLTGGTHHHPSWHHGSIQSRIEFLTQAKNDPSLVAKHRRRTRIAFGLYLIALVVMVLFI